MSGMAGLISAGAGLAAAIASNPYYAVKQYDYAVTKPVDNSTQYYNKAYADMTKRNNAFELMFQGERSVTAAKMRAVKQRTAVGLAQDEAEADIRMNAAVRGSGGGSVTDSIDQTHANTGYRYADIAVEEANSINKAKLDVYKGNQGSSLAQVDHSVDTTFTGGNDQPVSAGGNFSLAGAIMGAVANTDFSFLNDLGLASEDSGSGVAKQDYYALETGSVGDYGSIA